MKRVTLLVLTNLASIVVLSIAAQVLGLNEWLMGQGANLTTLLAFALLFGFGGAFLSLALSKWTAKRAMGVRVIDNPTTPIEAWLIATVRSQAQAAGIAMPEVGIFESPEPNAFATGARRNSALVAVSTGLLATMHKAEVEAVLAHEVSHVANGDMVTLTLIQGVVNTFVIFLARIIGGLVDRTVFRSEDGRGPAYFVSVIVSELLLGALATLVVLWFSRHREFRADAGGANLAGAHNMIAALQRLKSAQASTTALPSQFAAFGINAGQPQERWRQLFMSHPPLEERIAALRAGRGESREPDALAL